MADATEVSFVVNEVACTGPKDGGWLPEVGTLSRPIPPVLQGRGERAGH